MRILRVLAVAAALGPVLAASPAVASPQPGAPHCARQSKIVVPGAERQLSACLADLTTAGTTQTGHTDPTDWAGLSAAGTVNPTGVPGIQLDGYFPDTSTFNTNHGWNHDAQFVLRLPDRWNGGLVITGPPGIRKQYANDFIIADWVLAKGYAFASTDRGNNGPTAFRDGTKPAEGMQEWHRRMTQLTVAAKAAAAQRYGRAPRRTYVTGISAGGYLARWQLENVPWLYDGGVDWEGMLVTPRRNPLTFLPTALRAYPRYAKGDETAHREMLAAGFPAGSEPLWAFHHQRFWDPIQRILREEIDPGYDGDLEAGIPLCASGTPNCDADYDYFKRPKAVRQAVEKVSLTGRIGRPMLTLHGTLDAALPPAQSSDAYARMVEKTHRDRLFRYYKVPGGNHFDPLYAAQPGLLRPILPCYRAAFQALERWVDHGRTPPPSATLPAPTTDPVNTCSLTG